jgi:hypothetical protein
MQRFATFAVLFALAACRAQPIELVEVTPVVAASTAAPVSEPEPALEVKARPRRVLSELEQIGLNAQAARRLRRAREKEFTAWSDVDGDGTPDELTVSNMLGESGSIVAQSGATGHTLWVLDCPAHPHGAICLFNFTPEISTQDLDDDGLADLIGVEPGCVPYSSCDPDSGVWAVSSATGEVLWERVEDGLDYSNRVTGYGQGLALPADIDGDGLKDIVVGSWSESGFDVIDALSARTGVRLWRAQACDAALGVYAVDDCNGDGLADVVVPRWTDREGRLRDSCVYSSADGSLLFFAPGSEFSD